MKVAVIGRGAMLHRDATDPGLLRTADLVVECAGQAALAELGPPVRRAGKDLLVVSVGALADEAVFRALVDPPAELTGHVITATGTPGSYRFEINNRPDEHTPTTSAVVPFAVLRSIESLAGERLVLR